MAVDALEAGDHLVDLHAANECGDALGVAVAAAGKAYLAEDSVFDFDIDLPRAGALAAVRDLLNHGCRLFVFSAGKDTKGDWIKKESRIV